MLIFVIAFNCFLAIFCLLVAVGFWQLRGRLAKLNHMLKHTHQQAQVFLAQAPSQILGAQQCTADFNQNLQTLGGYLAQCQQALDLLQWGVQLWRWRHPKRPRRF